MARVSETERANRSGGIFMSLPKNNKLLDKAKALRHNMTPQEEYLWYRYLKKYPIKIYKQRIIGNYIVDFYCHQARLAIEIDGAHHFTVDGKFNDKARTEMLEEYGLYVLRFSNSDIDNHFFDVCNTINEKIKERCNI